MNKVENEKNIQLLKNIIQSGNKVAIFAGAGASVPLGIKTWKDLLSELAKRFSVNINIEECIINKGYPGTASEIYKRINNHDDYLNFLSEQFEPQTCEYTSLHIKIIKNFQAIFTTNYDNAFERAFIDIEKVKGEDFKRQNFPNFDPFTLFDKPTIVYLHGNNDERIYIFRKEEYDIYYPSISGNNGGSHELEDFLRGIFKKINLIFIGFSFDDSYFIGFLTKVLKEMEIESKIHEDIFERKHPREHVTHFAIISDDDASNINEIKKIGLGVITYEKEKHRQIGLILEKLTPIVVGDIEEGKYGR